MAKLTAEQVCDSKERHSEISAQYLISVTNKESSQSYYKCNICGFYHIYSINKKVVTNRKSKLFYKDERDVYIAKMHKKQRAGFKKKK